LKIRYPQNYDLAAEVQKTPLQKRRARSPFIKIDPRLACLLLTILLFSLPFVKGRDLWTLGAAGAAAIACLFAVESVGYSSTSFISIVALTHLIFYPLGAWGNLLLPQPAVPWNLWVGTRPAMWGCAVGVLFLALGARLANIAYKSRKLADGQIFANPAPLKFNILLASLVIPGGMALAALGLYYHGAVDPHFNWEGTWSLNLFGILMSIASCGIFLQTYRYTRTHSLKDLYWTAAIFLGPIIVFLPSGSRSSAMGFLPLLLLAFWKWETNLSRKILALVGVLVILFPLAAGMEVYRNEREIQRLSFAQKMDLALKATVRQTEAPRGSLPALAYRFSDYVAAGRIITDTPGIIGYRGIEGMEDWWQIYVPGFLNLIPQRINLNDGAETCVLYGITQFGGSSSPVMIVGDLFSRWGWAGVALGMMVLGFILRQLDLRIFNRWTTFTIIFFVLFGRMVVLMVSSSLLNIFIDFARDFAAMAIVSYFLAWIARTYFKVGKGNREAHSMRRKIA
jgi:hypothetical protein